jgi:hypothetical protein
MHDFRCLQPCPSINHSLRTPLCALRIFMRILPAAVVHGCPILPTYPCYTCAHIFALCTSPHMQPVVNKSVKTSLCICFCLNILHLMPRFMHPTAPAAPRGVQAQLMRVHAFSYTSTYGVFVVVKLFAPSSTVKYICCLPVQCVWTLYFTIAHSSHLPTIHMCVCVRY